MEFIRRFLQHVVPKGFVKIRYYRLFAPGKRNLLAVAKYLLGKIAAPTVSMQKHENEICPHCAHKKSLAEKTVPILKTPVVYTLSLLWTPNHQIPNDHLAQFNENYVLAS